MLAALPGLSFCSGLPLWAIARAIRSSAGSRQDPFAIMSDQTGKKLVESLPKRSRGDDEAACDLRRGGTQPV